MDLDGLLAEADKVFEAADPVTQDVLLGDRAVTVKLWPLPTGEWRDLIAQHPPRPKSTQDANFGYNVDAVVPDFPNVALLDGGEIDYMIRQDSRGKEVSRWPDVVRRLSSPDVGNLAVALWGMHEWTPTQRLANAGKASSGRGKKRNSPANSESQSEN